MQKLEINESKKVSPKAEKVVGMKEETKDEVEDELECSICL